MTALAYDSLEETDLGRAQTGVIDGTRISLSWTLDPARIKGLDLVVFSPNRAPQALPLEPVAAGAQTLEPSLPPVVSAMALVAQTAEGPRRLAVDPEKFFLQRLLSEDLEAVNRNLRWSRRIPDLGTRFFGAKNTVAFNPEDFEIQARCVVSVGYQGIEDDRPEIIDWCYEFCRDKALELRLQPDVEVRASIIIFWAHLAIWKGSAEDLFCISELIQNSVFDGMDSYPVGCANALQSLVLIGGFLLLSGRKADALRVFSLFQPFPQIAALKYPRALVNYREMIGVAQSAYVCKLGTLMAKGTPVPSGHAEMTATSAWTQGNRFRTPTARAEGLARYTDLITKHRL